MRFPLAYFSYGPCYSLGYSILANNGKSFKLYRIPIAFFSLSNGKVNVESERTLYERKRLFRAIQSG